MLISRANINLSAFAAQRNTVQVALQQQPQQRHCESVTPVKLCDRSHLRPLRPKCVTETLGGGGGGNKRVREWTKYSW